MANIAEPLTANAGPRTGEPPADPIATGKRALWWPVLLVVVAGGLALRLWSLWHWHRHMQIAGDAYYYHHAANLFADGRGWPLPSALLEDGIYQPYAQHPPMTSMLLAVPSVLGLRSFFEHQFFLCLVGALSVLVVGLAGRRIGGPVTGIVAAVLAAAYPGMWISDPLIMSETPGILWCGLLLLAAYRLWDRRRPLDVVWLGLALAGAMLTRAELALLAIVLVTPLVLRLKKITWRRRFGYLGLAALTSALAIGPWAAYNLSRFERPEIIETGFGVTMAVTQCDTTYYGPMLGWWSMACGDSVPDVPKEASQADEYLRKVAFRYIADHRDRLPTVVAARLGRTWGVYQPSQQQLFDTIEERPQILSKTARWSLYGLAAVGVGGLVVLLRRRAPALPLVATPFVLSVASALIYGTTRFRAVAEPSIVLLAATALGALITALARGPRHSDIPATGPLSTEDTLELVYPSTAPNRVRTARGTSTPPAGTGGAHMDVSDNPEANR